MSFYKKPVKNLCKPNELAGVLNQVSSKEYAVTKFNSEQIVEQHQNTITHSVGLYLMAVAYVLAGVNHFLNPAMYLRIMPDFVPFPQTANQLAGIAEIVLGIMLLFERTRNLAAWGIIALLIAVFPANIKMAHDYTVQQHPYAWLTWLRLPLQGILIRWAYLYTSHYQRRKMALLF